MDVPDNNDMFEMGIYEASGTSIHNVEEDIESWAMQSMPLMSDLSSDSQRTPLVSLPLDSSGMYHTTLCYGMVSRSLILLSAMSVPIVCVVAHSDL